MCALFSALVMHLGVKMFNVFEIPSSAIYRSQTQNIKSGTSVFYLFTFSTFLNIIFFINFVLLISSPFSVVGKWTTLQKQQEIKLEDEYDPFSYRPILTPTSIKNLLNFHHPW